MLFHAIAVNLSKSVLAFPLLGTSQDHMTALHNADQVNNPARSSTFPSNDLSQLKVRTKHLFPIHPRLAKPPSQLTPLPFPSRDLQTPQTEHTPIFRTFNLSYTLKQRPLLTSQNTRYSKGPIFPFPPPKTTHYPANPAALGRK